MSCQQQSRDAAAAKSLQLCPTLCDPINGSPPGSPVPGILHKLTSIKSVMPSNHLILCHPLLLLPSIFSSRINS